MEAQEVRKKGFEPEDGQRNLEEATTAEQAAAPPAAEVADHYPMGHIAYKSWCEHCVRDRGRHTASQKRNSQKLEPATRTLGRTPSRQADKMPCCGTDHCQERRAICLKLRSGLMVRLQTTDYPQEPQRANFKEFLTLLPKAAHNLMGLEVVKQASPEGDH
eukprot:2869805-Amphidinium_carterae.1